MFEEAEVWDIVEKTVTIPIDATQLAKFKNKNAKAKRLTLDGIKDHVIPHVKGKTHAFEMWAALTSLYQSSNENRKMVLREKLKSIKMTKSKNVASCLTKITQVRDELVAIGETVSPIELVRTTLQGLSKNWEVFVEGIIARENLPSWERLWDDYIQNEIRKNRNGATK